MGVVFVLLVAQDFFFFFLHVISPLQSGPLFLRRRDVACYLFCQTTPRMCSNNPRRACTLCSEATRANLLHDLCCVQSSSSPSEVDECSPTHSTVDRSSTTALQFGHVQTPHRRIPRIGQTMAGYIRCERHASSPSSFFSDPLTSSRQMLHVPKLAECHRHLAPCSFTQMRHLVLCFVSPTTLKRHGFYPLHNKKKRDIFFSTRAFFPTNLQYISIPWPDLQNFLGEIFYERCV